MRYFSRAIDFAFNQFKIRKYNISIGDDARLNGRIVFLSTNRGSINIGRNVIINSGEKYNVIGGDTRCIIRTIDNGYIKIGNNVGISNSSIISRNNIQIGDNVMIGGSCKIYDNDFHSITFSERMEKPDTHIGSEQIIIGDGVFIGAHSIILKGVKIGNYSIIGAGSVVTKDIPDGEIWGGESRKVHQESQSRWRKQL